VTRPNQDILDGSPAGSSDVNSSPGTQEQPPLENTSGEPPIQETEGQTETVQKTPRHEILLKEAADLESEAANVSSQSAKDLLMAEAALKRSDANAIMFAQAPKRTREQLQKERARERITINPEKDDLITAIRKLGGIDVDFESDWAGG
jgi:hypothetical protein